MGARHNPPTQELDLMATEPKDFRPRVGGKTGSELAGVSDPTEDRKPESAREIEVFSLDKFEDDYDFRPKAVHAARPVADVIAEELGPDPKDSSALASASSSSYTRPTEPEQLHSPVHPAYAVRDNMLPKEPESGTPTSSSDPKSGPSAPPAEAKT